MDTEKIAKNAMINGLKNQRDAYANESVTLAVQVALCNEKIKELMTEIDKLKAGKKKKKEQKPETV